MPGRAGAEVEILTRKNRQPPLVLTLQVQVALNRDWTEFRLHFTKMSGEVAVDAEENQARTDGASWHFQLGFLSS